MTGQTAEGESVFTHVEEVEPVDMGAGMSWYGVWGWEKQPSLPHLAEGPYVPRSTFPAPEGLRVNTVVFPAGYGVRKEGVEPAPRPAPPVEYQKLVAAQSPGGAHDKVTGMHSTNSVDFGFIFSGEISLEQESGEEVTLRPGDVYIQNGAVHAWRNRSAEPCVVCFVIMGAERE